ncbi:hypothetical protein HK101_000432, partial [Irineochytrium annulatum]
MTPSPQAAINSLTGLTSCEIADSLTKLGVNAYIINSRLIAPDANATFIGPAHTCEFVPITDTTTPKADRHHVDTLVKGQVMVIATKTDVPNAVWGGLMSTRARFLGCEGVVVEGRVRDVRELQAIRIPVASTHGTSVLGAGGFARPTRVGEPLTLCRDTAWPVVVREGDIIVGDVDGCVCVPIERCEE